MCGSRTSQTPPSPTKRPEEREERWRERQEPSVAPPASPAGGLAARDSRACGRGQHRAGEPESGCGRSNVEVGDPDESPEPVRCVLLLHRGFDDVLPHDASHSPARRLRAPDHRVKQRSSWKATTHHLRLHHQARDQVFGRYAADRSRRRILDERPPRPEDGLQDGRVLRQRRLDQAKRNQVTVVLKKPTRSGSTRRPQARDSSTRRRTTRRARSSARRVGSRSARARTSGSSTRRTRGSFSSATRTRRVTSIRGTRSSSR